MKTIRQLSEMKLRTTTVQKKKISNIVITAQHLDVSIEITARGYRFIDTIETDDNGVTTWKAFAEWVRLPLNERSLLVKVCTTLEIAMYQKNNK
jgi:hypothetical protein